MPATAPSLRDEGDAERRRRGRRERKTCAGVAWKVSNKAQRYSSSASNGRRVERDQSMPRRRVTALLCASKPSTAAMRATWGPRASKPSLVSSWTVMYLTKESKETPEYMRE